ncbi:MAG: nucleotidyltransferase family protein [Elusimicrobiales bacterium]|nr:nucleotidyltransferase family protein [Elusimicrobiales bacterium]
MKAIIFAAGYGTRLRPLTDKVPKPLIEVNGKTILQRALEQLVCAGADKFLVNTHHLHEKIKSFLDENKNFGLDITVSHEKDHPLETGGTLKANADFFLDGAPFFAVNGDVLSDADLKGLLRSHSESNALATLAVRRRPSSRHLMFDSQMRLAGREGSVPSEGLSPYGFSCAQVISPAIFDMIKEEGVFSITDVYIRLAKETGRIKGFEDRASYWFDIGSPEKLAAAKIYFKEKQL